MEFKTFIGVIASSLVIIGYIPYLIKTWRRQVKPHAFSWLIWGLSAGTAFGIQVAKGGGAGAWAIGLTSLLCASVGVSALFTGIREFPRRDWLALSLSLASLFLWLSADSPLLAVILLVIANASGFMPTIIKAHKFPEEESSFVFILSASKNLLSISALATLSLTTYLFPLSMALLDSVVIYLVLRGKSRGTE